MLENDKYYFYCGFRFILNLAIEEEGIIVSNDQYRDLHGERESYKDVVTKQ